MTADELAQEAVRRGGHAYRVKMPVSSSTVAQVSITVPIRLPSLSNVRMHWRALHKLKKVQAAGVFCYLADEPLPALPAVVTLTRIGKRTLDPGNLEVCFKAVQDQIAALYHVDDGSPLYRWEYKQEKGEYGVRIDIRTLELP